MGIEAAALGVATAGFGAGGAARLSDSTTVGIEVSAGFDAGALAGIGAEPEPPRDTGAPGRTTVGIDPIGAGVYVPCNPTGGALFSGPGSGSA